MKTPTEDAQPVRGIVPGTRVRVIEESVRVAIPHQASTSCPAEPQVELIRDGDIIQAIDVVCTCGMRIRLHCIFEKEGNA